MAKRRRNRTKLNRLVFIGLIVIVIYYMTRKPAGDRSGNIVPTDPVPTDPPASNPPPAGGGSGGDYQYPPPAGAPGSMAANWHIGQEDAEGTLLAGDDTRAYTLPATQNRINFESLEDISVTDDETYTVGYGGPFFSDIPNDENGKLIVFKKGVQHIINPGAYVRSRWNPENNYSFAFPQNTYKQAAIWANGSGQWNPAVHGGLGPMMNINSNVIPYETLTVAGAKLFGKFVADAVGSNNSVEDAAYNIPTGRSHTMFDCENEPDRSWAHGSLTDFYGYVFEGMMTRFEELTGESNPAKLEIYGQPISWFKKAVVNMDAEDLSALANQAKNIILNNDHAFKSAIWGVKKTYIELGSGYSKVPWLDNSVKIYQTNGDGSIKTAGGKPVYRTENFNINIFGRTETIWQSPHDWIKWGIVNNTTGEQKFGWQHAYWGEYNAGAYIQHPPAGWHWGNWVNNNPANWRPETEWFVRQVYQRADQQHFGFLMIRHAAKGNTDISYFDPTQMMLPSYTDRPQTEPFTFGGNSIDIRETGTGALKFGVYMYFLSGGRLYTTWDDGGYPRPWPSMGSQLYGKNDNYSRYIPGLVAYQSVFKELEGVSKSDLIYLHFYTPFIGHVRREVISDGIYIKSTGKLLVFFCNPSLENTQQQTVKLRAGGAVRRVILSGRDVKYKVMTGLPTGLTKNDFSLEYTNIYGQHIRKRGVLTEEFLNTYI